MNIGIFGGSYNPIHVGHIALAQHIRKECHLDKVWILVSPQNPLKEHSTLAPEQLRLQWAQLALKDEKNLIASDFEFSLPRPSYTWDTLQALSSTYPQHQFHLIIGGDNWDCFNQWYRWEDIIKNYRLIIYPRKNGSTNFDNTAIKSDNICFLSTAPLLDFSSTAIREKIENNESIEGLVPEVIASSVREAFCL